MVNRLADAISPYLRSHADNPVDWQPWGEAAFTEAKRRNVPVFISIGYATCHWCHVMARESFTDPDVAQVLNARFVSVKVDREEHPDVDASYLAAASAFTRNLGWPLSIFATPLGRVFFAGTYFGPEPRGDQPSFVQILNAVSDAWNTRREQVEVTAEQVTEALASVAPADSQDLPDNEQLDQAIAELASHEDTEFGGFGTAPKFPVAPALSFALTNDSGTALAHRTLNRMANSPLRDSVEGGFFRYAVQRDWSDPHYERMLYDNAQLLRLYADAACNPASRSWAEPVAEGIVGFLREIMLLPSGGFASAQDSESFVDGRTVEGGYYQLDAGARAALLAPKLDEKVLSGWNGLAIGALAEAGFVLGRSEWVELASQVADALIERHIRSDGALVRASIGERVSNAVATLEDYGMLASGLIDLALASGQVRYATTARSLVERTLAARGDDVDIDDSLWSTPFRVPEGADPVLVSRGLAIKRDPSEGAYPSGWSAIATAAYKLYEITGSRHLEDAARSAMRSVAEQALEHPVSYGAALSLMSALAAETTQLVVVRPQPLERSELLDRARTWAAPALVCAITEAQAFEFAAQGFTLFDARTSREGQTTAYLCRDFVCQLPVTDVSALENLH